MTIYNCDRCGEECAVEEEIGENETVICDDCYTLLYNPNTERITIH